MTGNPLIHRGLTVWLKWGSLGLGGLLFTVFGTVTPAFAASRADGASLTKQGTPCRSGDLTTEEIDPCLLVDLANELLSKLTPSTAGHLRNVAEGFDLERSLRVQQALLREDLIWQNRGFTDRQIDLMVFLAVALTLDKAAGLEIELLRSLEDSSDPEVRRRLERVRQYRRQAITFLSRVAPGLENLRDYELRFYF